MTLISLFAFLATNLSFGKEQKQEPWDVPCLLDYQHKEWDPFRNRYVTKTRTVNLGNVPRGGWGIGICSLRAQVYLETHYRDLETGI